jgi:tetratricopeptide (TPR) repeat protein
MDYQTEQLIEAYFAGTLSADEQLELKKRLESDAAAAVEFAWQQQFTRQTTRLSLAKGIQNDGLKAAAKPPFRKMNMTRLFMAAAAALALLVCAYLFVPGLSGGSSENIVAESFEHFPNKMKFKNLGESFTSPEVLEAFALYDQKKYYDATQKMMDVVNANPGDMELRFYLGVAFAGAQKHAETINCMTSVSKETSSPYSTPALYYMGIAYAGIKDTASAQKYLQQYIDAADGVTFRKKAKALLRSLK